VGGDLYVECVRRLLHGLRPRQQLHLEPVRRFLLLSRSPVRGAVSSRADRQPAGQTGQEE